MSQEFFFIFLTSVPAIFFKEYPPHPPPTPVEVEEV